MFEALEIGDSSDVRICCDGFEVCYAAEVEWIGNRGCSSVGCLRCLIGNEAVCSGKNVVFVEARKWFGVSGSGIEQAVWELVQVWVDVDGRSQ